MGDAAGAAGVHVSAFVWAAAAAGGWLLFKRNGGDLGGVPMAPSGQVSAAGVGPNGTSLSKLSDAFSNGLGGGSSSLGGPLDTAFGVGAKLDSVVAAGICTYYTGGAGAPACKVAGKVVSDVNEFQRKTTIKAAKYVFNKVKPALAAVGGEIKQGAAALPSIAKQAVITPVGLGANALELSGNMTTNVANKLDRAAQTAYAKSPTIVKIGLAPVAVSAKVGAKVVGATTAVANKVEGAAKDVESKAVNAGKKVLGFLGL